MPHEGELFALNDMDNKHVIKNVLCDDAMQQHIDGTISCTTLNRALLNI